MMTSEKSEAKYETAFVWIWLPGALEPVAAGRLDQDRDVVVFTYGRRYLANERAISLFLPELPLESGPQLPVVGVVAGCIRDAAPDGWGQRVIENRLVGRNGALMGDQQHGLLTYLLESGSNRIGALDFQRSPTEYVAREPIISTVAELMESADRVDAGIPLSPELDLALFHGTSIGGARPKATLVDNGRHLIAKFSSQSDTAPLVQFEFLGMELARRCGLNVAPVKLVEVNKRQVLMIERFDRSIDGSRRAMVSALTILRLDENGGRYASYADLADQIRARFANPNATLKEVFARMVFNINIGNTDDHARNHAGFWNGHELALTPAYDVSPWLRSGGETSQSMIIDRDGNRDSRLVRCLEGANIFHLDPLEARAIIDNQISIIEGDWDQVCEEALLKPIDRKRLRNNAVLHPSTKYGY
jgi:serine/threonine-protein kinase HipA